jgi:hypothetical protein
MFPQANIKRKTLVENNGRFSFSFSCSLSRGTLRPLTSYEQAVACTWRIPDSG